MKGPFVYPSGAKSQVLAADDTWRANATLHQMDWAYAHGEHFGLDKESLSILLYLVFRWTPAKGSYPAQRQIVSATRVARSTLNERLKGLEIAGLVKRETRPGRNGRRSSTQYRIPLMEDLGQTTTTSVRPTDIRSESVSDPRTGQCPPHGQGNVRPTDTNIKREQKKRTAEPLAFAGTVSAAASEPPRAVTADEAPSCEAHEANLAFFASQPKRKRVVGDWP